MLTCMRFRNFILTLLPLAVFTGNLDAVYPGQDDTFFFAPAAGQSESTAVYKDDISIVAWATGYSGVSYGSAVAQQWQTPVKALGPAAGDSFDVVSLGRGGEITLTFTNAIRDGAGADFAVFENGFSDTFLELAWVEVSTNGTHFVRFPNFSYTDSAAGSIDPEYVHGYASKYRQGYGTPFDLQQLQLAYDAAINETDDFDATYEQELEANFPHLDLDDIRYVRVVDIVGDGNAVDSEGFVIYDPYPTTGSAGLDLEAIAVINQVDPAGLPQMIDFDSIGNQRYSSGGVVLSATSTSGLPVSFEIVEGPASLAGSMLTFTGMGQVVIRAIQAGDGTYASAAPVFQSFYIADEIQHIFFEPVANQLINSTVSLHAVTTSGFPAIIEVVTGPFDVSAGFPPNQALQTGSITGTVVLRAYQVGGTLDGVTYAPADDVIMTVEVVSPGASNAPLTFAQWQAANSISGAQTQDSDMNGVSDFEEYAAGTDPNSSDERPRYLIETVDDEFVLELVVSRRAPVRVGVEANSDLANAGGWSDLIPEVVSTEILSADPNLRRVRLKVPSLANQQFWRFDLDSN